MLGRNRSFIAIDPDDRALDRLSALQDGMPAAKPTPEENLHLTLAFLGDRSTAELRALAERLEAIRAEPFGLTLRGLDLMGGRQQAVLVALAERSPELHALHRSVTGAAHAAGIVLERRRFRPHVTLARFRGKPDARRVQEFLSARATYSPVAIPVDHITLYRSDLHPDGARHTRLIEFGLTG